MGSTGSHSPGLSARSEVWLTPPEITAALGPFDLDPCGFPGWPTAAQLVCLPQDGLAVPWEGRVWLNPPYGREKVWAWLERLADHGRGTALIFARTDVEGFRRTVWRRATGLLFSPRPADLLQHQRHPFTQEPRRPIGTGGLRPHRCSPTRRRGRQAQAAWHLHRRDLVPMSPTTAAEAAYREENPMNAPAPQQAQQPHRHGTRTSPDATHPRPIDADSPNLTRARAAWMKIRTSSADQALARLTHWAADRVGWLLVPLSLVGLWVVLGEAVCRALVKLAGAEPTWTLWWLILAYLAARFWIRMRHRPVAMRSYQVGDALGVADIRSAGSARPSSVAADDPDTVARHEAAHAVAVVTGGGIVHRAHIIPTYSNGGQVIWSAPLAWPVQDRLWLSLVVALAGNLADLEGGVYDEGSTNDWLKAWSLAAAIASCGVRPHAYPHGPMQPGPIIAAAQLDARDTLSTHTDWLQLITDELIINRELDGEQIASLKPADPTVPAASQTTSSPSLRNEGTPA